MAAFLSPAAAAPVDSPAASKKAENSNSRNSANNQSSSDGNDAAVVTVITRVVGQVAGPVESRYITSREVRINDAIEQALNNKSEGVHVLTGQETTFPNHVSRVLDEWIIDLEANSFSAAPPSPTELAKVLKSVGDFWSNNNAAAAAASLPLSGSIVPANLGNLQKQWLELEVSPQELRSAIVRKLRAREFERLRGDVALVPVSDADALSYFQKNRLRFGTLPFESFKDNIKTFLAKQQVEMRLGEWHEVLRRKYKVRNFIAG